MICKNCGHSLEKWVSNRGVSYFEHKKKNCVGNCLYCDCVNPEPEKEEVKKE